MAAFCLPTSTIAFTAPLPLAKLRSFITILRLAQSNDFEGLIGDDNEAGISLAEEFSREVKQRQEQAAMLEEELSKSNRRLLSEEELRFLNNKPFGRREECIAGTVKEIGTTSAGFFSGRGQSVYSFPIDASPRRNIPQEENTVVAPISPLFIPTMAVIVLLSVYLTFGEGQVGVSLNEVEDWNAVQGATTVEQVMPSSPPPSVYL